MESDIIPTDRQVTYLCRDCLTTYVGHVYDHPGDQYCQPCKETIAATIAVACRRQISLEEMGFTPDQVHEDIQQWYAARYVEDHDA